MASISDVFDALNDVKGKLDQLHADNLNHNVLIEATNTKLDALDQSVASLETTLDGRLLSMLQEQQLGTLSVAPLTPIRLGLSVRASVHLGRGKASATGDI